MSMDVCKLNPGLRFVSRGPGGVKSREKTRNEFSENMSTYEHAMKLVSTDQHQEFVTQMLNEITEGLYNREIGQNIYSNVGSGCGFASLPDIERTQSRKNLIKKIVKTNKFRLE